MMYYSHNLHFIAMCSAMNGNYAEAKKNADMLAEHVGPARENDAAARRLHDHSDGSRRPFSSLG